MNILRELLNLSAKDLFALGVIAAIITTLGNLFATVLKDFFLARSFENWRAKRTLVSIYRRYKDPLLLASFELFTRVREITHESPANFLHSTLLDIKASRMETPTATDPYFMKYKLISTVYRFCALLGWFELYRQEVTYLDSGKSRINRKLENCISNIRSDLADGYLNAAGDREIWTDVYIFREEQRAIGELMICNHNNTRSILGYSAFCELLLDPDHTGKAPWLRVAANFIMDLDISNKEKNFRYIRWLLLTKHLIDLIEVLDKTRVPEKLLSARLQSQNEIRNHAIRELEFVSYRSRWKLRRRR